MAAPSVDIGWQKIPSENSVRDFICLADDALAQLRVLKAERLV